MFYSCRLCQRPTNLWLDFCDACALEETTPELRAVQGGRTERDDRRQDQSKSEKESKLTLVRD